MRSLRGAAFVASFLLVAWAVPTAIFRSLDAAGVEYAEVGLDVTDALDEALPALRAGTERSGGTFHVAFLGDSMVVSYPPGRRVPARLEQVVADTLGDARPVRVHTLAAPGMGPFDYYFIADIVSAEQPDQVILPINLTVFSDGWRGAFSRPELAGWMDPARIPEAITLPLDWIGMTADQLLSAIVLVQAGLDEPWHALLREQARLGRVRTSLTLGFEEILGSTGSLDFGVARYKQLSLAVMQTERKRFNAAGHRDRFAVVLDGVDRDDPVLEVLGAAIRRFESAGIPVLVYINPTNVEPMAEQGILDERGLARTLAAIAETVRASGGEFVDLHRLLPDAAFRDAAGHFAVVGDVPDGPLLLARALSPWVVAKARRAPAATD